MKSRTFSGRENTERHYLSNIEGLRQVGVDPYPAEAYLPSHSVQDVRQVSATLSQTEQSVRLAGRLVARRSMGRVKFYDIQDGADRLQLYLSEKDVDPLGWQIAQFVDIGDLIGVDGEVFTTRKGELSLKVRTLTMLGKCLRSPPLGKTDSDGLMHQPLSDRGQLRADRHILLLTDEQFRNRMIKRDQLIREIRSYFQESGFVEVDTPVLGGAYGGAAARPFVTHSKSLKQELFLRVSPECSLKRALCGGLNRVFEIGKCYRNEGIDHSHSPEFTSIEWYEAWTSYITQMKRFESLVARMVLSVQDSYWVRFRGKTFDFTPPWPRLRVSEAVAEALNLPHSELTITNLNAWWDNQEIDGARPTSWGEMVMAIFEEVVEPTLIGPVMIIDHPVDVSPLTKRHRSDPRLAERFEPFVGGLEIGNGYSELNDPVEQRERLSAQDLARDDPYGLDEAFVRAIENGMPQAGGAGMGIDRIVMILTDAERLSDVILFPAA